MFEGFNSFKGVQKYYIFLKYAKKEANICVYPVFFVTLRDIWCIF